MQHATDEVPKGIHQEMKIFSKNAFHRRDQTIFCNPNSILALFSKGELFIASNKEHDYRA